MSVLLSKMAAAVCTLGLPVVLHVPFLVIHVNYCRRKELMASVRKPGEKLCVSVIHPSKTGKKAPKVGGFKFPCEIFEFRRVGTRFPTIFLEVFARRPFIVSYDDTPFHEESHDLAKVNKRKRVLPAQLACHARPCHACR